MLVSLWCVRMIGLTGILGRVYHIGVKFGVARFDIDGQYSGALDSEAGNEWASRSLFICLEILLIFSMPEPHRTNTFSSFIIAESLNEIHMSNNCSSLSTVVLPNGATTIGESAFEGCSVLENIVLPMQLEEIDSLAFKDCTNLDRKSVV